jgi:ABC-type transport system involved in multi-copper enzyme maturation permease subunit
MAQPVGWALWTRQVRAMIGLELRKTFLRARALPVVLVAFLPALLLGLRALARPMFEHAAEPASQMALAYANVFQLLFVRLVIFFGCFGLFTYLVRGEVAERSLHFYLLAPLRREVFLAGKFVAGVLAGWGLFGASLVLQLGFAFLPGATAGGRAYLLSGPGLGQAAAYAGVTLLAVVGYGALFLALGLLVRNPMIPAAALLGWEWLNFLLPPLLQKISVIHYLQSLCPLPIPRGPFALPTEPTPPLLAVPGLLLVTALLLWVAMRRARRLEVAYAAE